MTSSISVSFRSSYFLPGTSGHVYPGQNEQRSREIWPRPKESKEKGMVNPGKREERGRAAEEKILARKGGSRRGEKEEKRV